jgi:hypothetical protein
MSYINDVMKKVQRERDNLKKDYTDPYYNLACLHARTNEIDESLWYLMVTATIDGDTGNWIKTDAGMKNIAACIEFKRIEIFGNRDPSACWTFIDPAPPRFAAKTKLALSA